MNKVLIVDDEAGICWALRESLSDDGYEVHVASNAEDGLKLASTHAMDVVVLDVRLPGMDGLTAMSRFQKGDPAPRVVVMTAFGDLDTAVRAMEGGAFEYLVKPFDLDRAGEVIRRAREAETDRRAPPPDGGRTSDHALIGSSPAMQALFRDIALVAPTDVPVLITGESGTGKELVARAIHRHGSRRGGPFLPICVPALSPTLVERELFGHVRGAFTGADHDRKGLLELANGGTVLFDEVGDVPQPLQVKLLRAIEHREITPVGDARPRPADIRVVAATNRPLESLMTSGEFREDLFFRLSVFPIRVPPLRDRVDDIPDLARRFLLESKLPQVDARLSDDVLAELRRRTWVGNVRELRNAVERAAIVARGRPIRPEHLPPPSEKRSDPSTFDLDRHIKEWLDRESRMPAGELSLHERFLEMAEAPLLRALMEQQRGNRAAAAQLLGIHRATLRQKLKRYGLDSEPDRP